ncbi:MAG: hypothetical protein JW864_07490 [Spirochaetes bacterium]|nr:hypothetical protein [Spirochaetota bacterium]
MFSIIKKLNIIILIVVFSVGIINPDALYSENISLEYWDREFRKQHISIKSVTGKLYASIVLLFNENPHFINLIQEGSVSSDMIQMNGFHIKEYKNYLETIKNSNIRKLADLMFDVYMNPGKFDKKSLERIQGDLENHNIILRFSKITNAGSEKIVLDYCIFGRKEPVQVSHPFFESKEKIFNIQPFIYYDEFSTSNSTFYFDMIYINPDEVHNDYLIAKNIISGKNVEPMFFVGARINDNIKYCLANAFRKKGDIKTEILQMFIVHEITHKILNNHYGYFDQAVGEEIALLSTIYLNPFLGLSVMYSYLDYSRINPHRIAAMNSVRYIAKKTGKMELIDDPSGVKYLNLNEIKKYTKERFIHLVKNLK